MHNSKPFGGSADPTMNPPWTMGAAGRQEVERICVTCLIVRDLQGLGVHGGSLGDSLDTTWGISGRFGGKARDKMITQ